MSKPNADLGPVQYEGAFRWNFGCCNIFSSRCNAKICSSRSAFSLKVSSRISASKPTSWFWSKVSAKIKTEVNYKSTPRIQFWLRFDLTFNESILSDLSWIVFWSSWMRSSSLFLVMSEMSDNWARSNCNMPSSSDNSPQTSAFSILKLASVSSN